MSILFGVDPVRDEVERLIALLQRGAPVDRSSEGLHVDLKEETGRRGHAGTLLPGEPRDDRVAQQLAAEAACMSNTPGGGALIVGVTDHGEVVGAASEPEWLRGRIHALTNRQLTVEVASVAAQGKSVLVMLAPAAIEPIRYRNRIAWRIGDTCVEVDATTWHARNRESLQYDWSADSSGLDASRTRPAALQIARDFLIASGDGAAQNLAESPDSQLLRRLNAVDGKGELTHAGALMFLGRESPCMDYVFREVDGGDSLQRIRLNGRSLLEELRDIFSGIDAHNSTRHLSSGLTIAQVKDIPTLAAREAVVNGIAHREWHLSEPTVVEHVGRTLRVTSPGGFFGSVNESNIITHPSQSRNKSLTQMFADLRIAEREGIGVDRMVREMIRLGHGMPDIREISGPYVRTSLVGDTLDEAWMEWLGMLKPTERARDVSSLLILRRIVTEGWADPHRVAELIQLGQAEAEAALSRLEVARFSDSPVLQSVEGVPEAMSAVRRLDDDAIALLQELDAKHGKKRSWPTRRSVARTYARDRGRISSTELASLTGGSPSNMGPELAALAREGVLTGSSPSGRGRGFHYLWTGET